MHKRTLAGAILVIVGLWLILWPPRFGHQENTFKLGALQATFEEQRPIPGWIGGMVLGAGLVLVVMGLQKGS